MSAAANSRFAATVSLSEVLQPIPLPKNFVIDVDLVYPTDYHPDRDEMVDHLLRNSSIYQTSPFALINETEQKLTSSDPSLVYKKISYQLEPQLPGKYALTFYDIPFIPNDSNLEGRVEVISTIVYVDVVLPEAAVINLSSETAPLSSLSDRIPIELNSDLRAYISRDQSTQNVEVFKNKELPWHFVLGSFFLLLLFACTVLMYNYSKKRKPVKLDANHKFPLVEAENLLQEIKGQSSLDGSVVQEFISKIITSLRNFLKNFYRIPASALTTQEFLNEVEMHSKLTLEQKESIKEVLKLSDQIKFGGYKPSIDECTNIFDVAKNVNKT
ncbi:MAG: hypothetical protein H0W50_11830 [Parachlamydiaceae bacterium]|nr:hypothetical protein [Parachlamydiaceae bacterium]